jgi:hypothetical protein
MQVLFGTGAPSGICSAAKVIPLTRLSLTHLRKSPSLLLSFGSTPGIVQHASDYGFISLSPRILFSLMDARPH